MDLHELVVAILLGRCTWKSDAIGCQNLLSLFNSKVQPFLHSCFWQWHWITYLLEDQSTILILQDWLHRNFIIGIQRSDVPDLQSRFLIYHFEKEILNIWVSFTYIRIDFQHPCCKATCTFGQNQKGIAITSISKH